jgi:hypothetical protein
MWFNHHPMKSLTWVLGLLAGASVGIAACDTETVDPMGGTGGTSGGDITVRTTEPCESGATECVSEGVGRVCPEGPEPGWVYFACGDTEVCESGTCVLDPDQNPSLGLCQPGSRQCASDALARVCSLGGDSWIPDVCASGTICSDGERVAVDAGSLYDACDSPGAVECKSATLARVCLELPNPFWADIACPGGCNAGTCLTFTPGDAGNEPPDAGSVGDPIADAAPADASDASDGG